MNFWENYFCLQVWTKIYIAIQANNNKFAFVAKREIYDSSLVWTSLYTLMGFTGPCLDKNMFENNDNDCSKTIRYFEHNNFVLFCKLWACFCMVCSGLKQTKIWIIVDPGIFKSPHLPLTWKPLCSFNSSGHGRITSQNTK